MTFWKLFDGRMKISWNFITFRSGHRIFFKKSSEVNRRCAYNPLTSYFGFITIWWVFADISSKTWIILRKKFFFSYWNFFLLKEKNVLTSGRATAPYIANIFKIWVLGIIFMLRRVRSTCVWTPCVHTEGTEIADIRHKNRNFSCILAMSNHSQISSNFIIFSKIFFSRKST